MADDHDEQLILSALDLRRPLTLLQLIDFYDYRERARLTEAEMRAVLERLVRRGLASCTTDNKYVRAPTLGDELEAACYAQLDDDARRAVWADWLTQQGDLRGELVTLQLMARERALTAQEQRREQKLLARHWSAWLGPLAAVVERESTRFARGFLVDATLLAGLPRLLHCVHDWRWATVETLRGPPLELLAVLLEASLPSLRAVDDFLDVGVSPSLLARADRLTRLTRLRVRDVGARLDVLLLVQLRAFAALEELELRVGHLGVADALVGRPAPAARVRVTLDDALVPPRLLVRDAAGRLAPARA